jgi:hypothetical protein
LKANADKNDVILKTPGNLEIMSLQKAYEKFRHQLPENLNTPHKLKMYLKKDDATNGTISLIDATNLGEKHYEEKTKGSYKFPKTLKRNTNKAKALGAPLARGYDVDKDNEIKKADDMKKAENIKKSNEAKQAKIDKELKLARTNRIEDILKTTAVRSESQNYLFVKKNGEVSLTQPKDFVDLLGIPKNKIAASFGSNPFKKMDDGRILVHMGSKHYNGQRLINELDSFLDKDITTHNVNPAHVATLQKEEAAEEVATPIKIKDMPENFNRSTRSTNVGAFKDLLMIENEDSDEENSATV